MCIRDRYYRPENAFEKSVLTRLEKIPTDIYESVEEGANSVSYTHLDQRIWF